MRRRRCRRFYLRHRNLRIQHSAQPLEMFVRYLFASLHFDSEFSPHHEINLKLRFGTLVSIIEPRPKNRGSPHILGRTDRGRGPIQKEVGGRNGTAHNRTRQVNLVGYVIVGLDTPGYGDRIGLDNIAEEQPWRAKGVD